MNPRWFVGLASASSAEGVDAALLALDGIGLDLRIRRLETLRHPYDEEITRTLRQALRPEAQPAAPLGRVHRILGETFAAATLALLARVPMDAFEIQCIACPGHTVWHDTDSRLPTTLPVGMAAVVAERLGVTVLSDLRARDLATGGHGSPLAALPDFLLFRHPNENRVLLHLGGVTRIVYLPATSQSAELLGWEAGPCNSLLDALMRHMTSGRERFDSGGKHAVQGKCNEALLAEWLGHPFLQRRPPRTLPRHLFADDFAAEAVRHARASQITLHDLLCTATHFVARCIGDSLRRWLPPGQRLDRVLLSGGGVRNGLLWHRLAQHFGNVPMERTDAHHIPAGFRKAVSYGLHAALFLDGVPANVPSVTGAAGARLLGSLTPGSPSHWARTLAWMAAQSSPLPLAEDADAEW
jgi:anhydro-N-acetylmuramic acid kinase